MIELNFKKDVQAFLEQVKASVKEDVESGIKINSPYPLEQFHGMIGLYSAKKVGKFDEIENMTIPRVDKDLFYIYIGQQLLDYYIPNTYKVCCGNVADGTFKEYIIRKVVDNE